MNVVTQDTNQQFRMWPLRKKNLTVQNVVTQEKMNIQNAITLDKNIYFRMYSLRKG
jgi:hypothetical protein